MPRFIPPPELLDSPVGRRLDGPAEARCRVAADVVPSGARVVIVGGGLAAITLASHLWHRAGLTDVVILDQQDRPGRRFFDRTSRLRQRVLRSPYEHHVGAHNGRDCELLDFARTQWRHLTPIERDQVRMAMSGQRAVVPMDVFAAYVAHVTVNHGIADRVWRTTVHQVTPVGDRWQVRHEHGVVDAGSVVFAVGERCRPVPPRWRGESRISSWADDLPAATGRDLVTVIGSGLSAAHVISEVCGAGGRVRWVQRSSERYQCADVDARFFRPEGRAQFVKQDLPGRLALLRHQRQPSIMYEFRPLLRRWEELGRLTVHRRTEVSEVEEAGGDLCLRLSDGTRVAAGDRVVCAFGTEPEPLPLSPAAPYRTLDNLPILQDATLAIAGLPGVHVTGAHAALSVGPAARNIDGMRVAAQRITQALLATSEG